jgi:hypothetical protein
MSTGGSGLLFLEFRGTEKVWSFPAALDNKFAKRAKLKLRKGEAHG